MSTVGYSFYLVVDPTACRYFSLLDVVAQAVQQGVDIVQLRAKQLNTADLFQLAAALKKLLSVHHIPLLINDRVDIALAINADGVHIGQTDLPYAITRELLGAHKIIGLTVENSEQAKIANQYDLDYIGVGPVFVTASKLDAPAPLGIEKLAEIVALSRHPVVAIGGIQIEQVKSVMATGAAGIAVISAVCGAKDPAEASRSLKTELLK